MEKIWKFIKDEDGLETSEYAVMGALIVIALVGAVIYLQSAISAAFERIADTITTAS
jgi:Flp pilus assembly pilin Flp